MRRTRTFLSRRARRLAVLGAAALSAGLLPHTRLAMAVPDPDPPPVSDAVCPAELSDSLGLPSLDIVDTAEVGWTPGNFAVTTSGEATYTIPLSVPPGRAGMAPSLAITYSSAGGDGLLGRGFGLSGLSRVTRCIKNFEIDGDAHAVTYDDNDVYCLDGARLLLVTDQGDEKEYRTIPDSHVRVRSVHTGLIPGPTYFEVDEPSGIRKWYGTTNDSRAMARTGYAASWAMAEVKDRHDNGIQYQYVNVTTILEEPQVFGEPLSFSYTGEQYLAAIHYTTPNPQRSVEFEYEDMPALHSYAGWMDFVQTKRLKTIAMYGPNHKHVRDYTLSYEGLDWSSSRLSQVQECAYGWQGQSYDRRCLQPTRFEWSSGAADNAFARTETPIHVDEGASWALADVNGDGLDDVILSEWIGVNLFRVALGTGDPTRPFQDPAMWLQLIAPPGVNGRYDILPADVDSDGRTDLVLQFEDDESPHVTWLRSSPANAQSVLPHFEIVTTTIPRDPAHDLVNDELTGENGLKLGDFDGDGAIDLLRCHRDWTLLSGWQQGDAFDVAIGADHYATEEEMILYRNEGGGTFSAGTAAFAVDCDSAGRMPVAPMFGEGKATVLNDGYGWMQVIGTVVYSDATFSAMRQSSAGSPFEMASTHLQVRNDVPADEDNPAYFDAVAIDQSRRPVIADFNGDGISDAMVLGRQLRDCAEGEEARTSVYGSGCWDTHAVVTSGRSPISEYVPSGWLDLPVAIGQAGETALFAPRSIVKKLVDQAIAFHHDDDTMADVLFPLHGSCSDDPDTTCWVVLRSTGHLASPFDIISTDIPYRWETSPGEYEDPKNPAVLPADVDMNGRADLVVLEPGNDLAVYRRTAPMNRVTSIIEGRNPRNDNDPKLVPSVEIEYGPLVDRKQTETDLVAFGDEPTANTQAGPKPEDLYQARWHSQSCAWPVACVAGTRQVVSKYRLPDGLEGQRGVQMLYRDGRYDVSGHRWLGFGAVMRVDLDTLSGKATFMDNEHYEANLKVYPFAGLPSSSWEWKPALPGQPNAHQLELTFTGALPSVIPTVSGSYFPYSVVTRAWTDEAEFDSSLGFYALMDKVQQEAVYPTNVLSDQYHVVVDLDVFGNVLSETSTTVGAGSETVTRTFDNDTTNWILGREHHRETCSTAGAVTQCRNLWQYHDSYGLLTHSRVGDLVNPTTVLHTWLTRDTRGNVLSTVQVDGLGEKRSACSTWDAEGVFVLGTSNSEALDTRAEYDRGQGVKVAEQDPNGLVMRWARDGFGRAVRQINKDNTEVSSSLSREPGCGDDGLALCTRLTTTTTTGSWQQTWADALGRTVRTLTAGPDVDVCTEAGVCQHHATIVTDELYDHLGRKVAVSRPYILGDVLTPKQHEEIEYDAAGREVLRSQPGGLTIETTYDGLTVTRWDGQRETVTSHDRRGRVESVTDNPVGTITAYEYGPFGATSTVQINSQAAETTAVFHDAYGRAIEHHDPDQGTTTTVYNGYGEPKVTTDALGRTVTLFRDGVGRVVTRQDADGASIYDYDLGANGKGKLVAERLVNQGAIVNERHYTYDAAGRIAGTSVERNGEVFASQVSYDPEGRPFELTYPDDGSGVPFKVKTVYDSRGNIVAVDGMRLGNGPVQIPGYERLWELKGVHASGRTKIEQLGNDVATTTDINAGTGAVTAIETTSPAQLESIQSLTYDYDLWGNLEHRGDALQDAPGVPGGATGVSEWFDYDTLGRLTCTRVAPGDFDPQVGCNLAIDYKSNGNILSKSDVGDYAYGDPAHPHAVTSTAGPAAQQYDYDAVGNQTLRGPVEITYTARNKPHEYILDGGGQLVQFEYTANGERLRKASPGGETLWFENLYERRTDSEGTVEHRFHVFSRDRVAVDIVRIAKDGEPPEDAAEYQHVDHLGSLDVVTDDDGAVTQRISFDAFGRRRDPEWLNAPGGPFDPVASLGFTGQQEDPEIGVIDMRARLYDPLLGRFLNVDPHVTNPLSAQSWNAYSYVRNRPTVFIDPTGMDYVPIGGYTGFAAQGWAFLNNFATAAANGVGAVIDYVSRAGNIPETDGSASVVNNDAVVASDGITAETATPNMIPGGAPPPDLAEEGLAAYEYDPIETASQRHDYVEGLQAGPAASLARWSKLLVPATDAERQEVDNWLAKRFPQTSYGLMGANHGADLTEFAVITAITAGTAYIERAAAEAAAARALPSTLDPAGIRFMQSSIKNATGEYTVVGNAERLYTGSMSATELPAIRVWHDAEGVVWTLDHRRLAAFRLAGTEQIPVTWASEETVSAQMWKMTTTTEGLSIRLKFGDGSFFMVE